MSDRTGGERTRRRVLIAVLGVFFLSITLFYIWEFSQARGGTSKAIAENCLRISSANVDFRNDRISALAEELSRLKADILVLLEWRGQNPASEMISGMHPVIQEINGQHGIAVLVSNRLQHFVRGEVFYTGIESNSTCRIPMAIIQIDVGSQQFAIVGIHIPPPHLERCQAFRDATLEEISQFFQEGLLVKKFRVIDENIPAIVLGDFNAFPSNPNLLEFNEKGMKNAFPGIRSWLLPTWPARVPFVKDWHRFSFLPMIHIDNILISKMLQKVQSWSYKIPGSDHRGLAVDILLEENNFVFIDEKSINK